MIYPFMYFDSTWILVLMGIIITGAASLNIKHTYSKYSKVISRRGLTGADVAQQIIRVERLPVRIQGIPGNLTDNYDPRNKTINLSDSVRNNPSLAAIGVAAHECGHAIQDNREYFPLVLRRAMVPVTNIGSMLAMPLILVGVIMSMNQTLINLGIILFSLAVAFQLITLPVELNASRRAINILESSQI